MDKSIEMQAHIEAWECRNVSIKSYCEEAGLAQHVFRYWLKKHKAKSNTEESGFITIAPPDAGTSGNVRIVYPNGVLVELPADSPTSQIRSLIQL